MGRCIYNGNNESSYIVTQKGGNHEHSYIVTIQMVTMNNEHAYIGGVVAYALHVLPQKGCIRLPVLCTMNCHIQQSRTVV